MELGSAQEKLFSSDSEVKSAGFEDNLYWLLRHRKPAVIFMRVSVSGGLFRSFPRQRLPEKRGLLATNPHSPTNKRNPSATQLPAGPDDILMERLAAGDQDALMAAYDQYSPLVYALSLHVLRNPQSAEDVMQEVFLRLWRKASAYNPARGSLAGWLTVMARHQAIDSFRRTHRELPVADAVVPINRMRPNVPAYSADLVTVRSILEKLPAEQREVLDLAYFAGLTHAEIASHTGKPLGTVKSRIRLALQSLRRLLMPAGKDRR